MIARIRASLHGGWRGEPATGYDAEAMESAFAEPCFEGMENRLLLDAVSDVRAAYPDLSLPGSYNVIEIAANNLNATALNAAIATAGTTTANDLIILRTTGTQNTLTLGGTQLTIDIDAAEFGTITIVSLGSVPLTIDAQQNSRVFYIDSEAVVGLAGLTIANGFVDGAASSGGGIYNWGGTLTIVDSTVTGNSADFGGGINNLDGVLTMINSTVTGNSTGYFGGGIYMNGGTLTVTGSTFTGNLAADGGGIFQSEGTLNVTNSTFTGNSTDSSGGAGGAMDNHGGTVTITNSLFTGNSADYGGGIRNSDGAVTVTNSTITGNLAGTGGGIDNWGTLTVNNTIVAGNTASDEGADLYNFIYEDIVGTISGHNNLIGNGTGQTSLVHGSNGNIVGTVETPINPGFENAAGGNYRLAAGSPAINKGDNTLIPSGITTDLSGNTRIANGTVDIGAYEYGAPVPPNPSDLNFNIAESGKKIKVTFDVKAGDVYTVVVAATNAKGKTTYTFKTYTAKKDATITYNVSGKAGSTYNIAVYKGKVTKKTLDDAAANRVTSTEFVFPVFPKLKKIVTGDNYVRFQITNWDAVKEFALVISYWNCEYGSGHSGDSGTVTLPAGGGSDSIGFAYVSVDANGVVTFTDLYADTKYRFEVGAKSGPKIINPALQYVFILHSTLTLKTAKMAYAQVEYPRITRQTSDSLTVEWNPAKGRDGGGNGATGYTVTVTDPVTGKVVKTLKTSKSANSGTVKGLKPNTDYVVTVKANGDKNYSASPDSAPVAAKTAELLKLTSKSLMKTANRRIFTVDLGADLSNYTGQLIFSASGSGSMRDGRKVYSDSASATVVVDFTSPGQGYGEVYVTTKKYKETDYVTFTLSTNAAGVTTVEVTMPDFEAFTWGNVTVKLTGGSLTNQNTGDVVAIKGSASVKLTW